MQQEPRLTAYVSNDMSMIQTFMDGRDIYASIASVAFKVPYEECLEFGPDGQYQPEGKKRRNSSKSVLLGILYGRSVQTIAEQLLGDRTDMTDEEKIQEAQGVYDAVLLACPGLRNLMASAQATAREKGYVETILGRRRHIPDMQLTPFEFRPMPGYINPDVDPLDLTTLNNSSDIPERIVQQLLEELTSYKYYGQVIKRTKELAEKHKIRVINNNGRITEASRKCVNSIVQGSAADLTKMAMLHIENSAEWRALGAELILAVHDELIAEVPIEHYERGAELLSELMCKAADFMSFGITCDTEISYRWYGMSYPCQYPQPEDINNLSIDEVRWVKYHLFECGYPMKSHKVDGKALEGDEALGVDSVDDDDFRNMIRDYIKKYRILEDDFIYHIHHKVHTGNILRPEEIIVSR